MSNNDFYDLSINGVDVLSITVCTCDVHSMHELSVSGLKRLPVNIHLCDVIESVDVMSESGLPGLNGLGPEFSLNVLNGLNELGLESSQEHILSRSEF